MKSATETVIIFFVLIECYANFTNPNSAPSHFSSLRDTPFLDIYNFFELQIYYRFLCMFIAYAKISALYYFDHEYLGEINDSLPR